VRPGTGFRANTDTPPPRAWHAAGVDARRARWTATLVVGIEVAAVLAGVVSDRLLVREGRADLASLHGETWVLILGVASAAVVGFAVTRSQPSHPVGWLFLALSASILVSGPLEAWIEWGAMARPGSLPATGQVAAVNDSTWIPWFVLVALILLLTPTGTHLSPRWRVLARVIAGAGALAFVLSLAKTEPFEAPFQDIENPWALPAIQPAAAWVEYLLVLVVAVGLVAAGVSLLLRWRRARGDDRHQLLWLALVVVPLPVFVVGAFAASAAESEAGTVLATGGFVVLVPIAAGLSITRYHLYDVQRILTATATYVLLTLVLVLTYAFVVWAGARGAQEWSVSPAIAATLGAVAAAIVAEPARRVIQRALDRKFNRRQYEAKRLVRGELARETAEVDVEDLLRRALADDSVAVAYPGPGADEWVSPSGAPRAAPEPAVSITRHEREVARVGFDPSHSDIETVGAVARIAAADLDNGRLRAELVRQVAEISASRQRLAEAQRDERRRVERDLHDGAQQRLLALAFDLQSAQLSGDSARMQAALAEGATAAQTAVRELRELANGLHPAALADGGLPAALDDLAQHTPVPVRLDVQVGRLDPALEFTAWLVIGEAVVNAQKHARASEVRVSVGRAGDAVRIEVCDDGRGGANPVGPGLRGMRDRVEAAGGRLLVSSSAGSGTRIEAVLPCAS
jgi:signal transduction histidine kinase